ncbi:MAG TPA: putative cytokinetic ring protein SteA [Acidimicrobiales bacterium]|nr:putative cytokinetic ring protein SteA [Acidimicrobiales bacterium]
MTTGSLRNGGAIVVGPARVDRRTKDLIPRLNPGDVAIIDHEDLDRIAAEGLVEARPAAVVNAAPSISGRYPNVGPLLLAAARIPLVDATGAGVMERIREGQVVRVDGSGVWLGDERIAEGARQDLQSLEHAFNSAKANLGDQLQLFAENTLEYLRRERHLVLDEPALPPVRTKIDGRHVLIVVRGADYREDLAHLRSYIDELSPVLVGVDGGADALLEMGYKPDIILGDFDSVSDAALRVKAELIVHAFIDGRAPGAHRLEELGLAYSTFASSGTSEDIAMLLAYEKGAELIVAVGTHASMVEFLDKGRAGMASTFLVRLKVGPILVDAKGVSRLYQTRIRKRDFSLFLFAVMAAFVSIGLAFYPVRVYFRGLWVVLKNLW